MSDAPKRQKRPIDRIEKRLRKRMMFVSLGMMGLGAILAIATLTAALLGYI